MATSRLKCRKRSLELLLRQDESTSRWQDREQDDQFEALDGIHVRAPDHGVRACPDETHMAAAEDQTGHGS